MNFKHFLCFFLIFTFFLHPPLVYADEGEPVEVTININLDEVINAINGFSNGVNNSFNSLEEAIIGLATAIVNAFFDFVRLQTINLVNPLLSLVKEFITTNPDPLLMLDWWRLVVTLISMFYLLLFVIVGLMFIFGSIDSKTRTIAKTWLKNVLILIITLNISFYLYQTFLLLGSGIAQYMWTTNFETIYSPDAISGLNIFLLGTTTTTIILAFITLFIRHLFLLIGVVLFPIGIFFYLIPPLRGWGSIIFNLLGAAILMQFIDVICFTATQLIWQQFTSFPDAIGWTITTAFALIAIVNTLMILFAGTKAIISTLKETPTLNTVVNVVTGPLSSAVKMGLV